jgi:hypothetical protein
VDFSEFNDKAIKGLVGDSPEGPLRKPGGILLKTYKKHKTQTHLEPNAKRIHTAQPTPRWPPRPTRAAQQGTPSSRSASLEGSRPPRAGPPCSRAHASLERTPPCSRVPTFLEQGPPRSRSPHERTYSRTRVRAFNALTRQSRTTTCLEITPRLCSANSLEGAHPRHCGGLCDEAGVSSVTLSRPL